MKKNIFLALILLFINYISYSETIIQPGTQVFGTWTAENSPYIIMGEAIVPQNQTLNITNGTIVKFKTSTNISLSSADFKYSTLNVGMLRVNGKLIANGALFTKNAETNNSAWGTIFFAQGSNPESYITNSRIEYSYVVTNVVGTNGCYAAISFYNSTATISNCEIINNFYGGIECDTNCNSVITQNIISNNSTRNVACINSSNPVISNNTIQYSSIGIYVGSSSNPEIKFNYIKNNQWGLDINNGKGNIFKNEINDNSYNVSCKNDQGTIISYNKIFNSQIGVNCDHSKAIIINNVILANFHGIDCDNASKNTTIYPSIINNLISLNSRGIFCWYSTNPKIINNTIALNQDYGIYCYYNSSPQIINTIIYNNGGNIGFEPYDTASHPIISYSLLQTDILPAQCINGGNNLLNINPNYQIQSNQHITLNSDSPCINAGTLDTTGLNLPPLDILENPRIVDGRIDLGAYEYQTVDIDNNSFYLPNLSIFPNPSNSTITINYDLEKSQNISIEIFNVLGEKITTLFEGYETAGRGKKVVWNGKYNSGINVPSGIYFCKIKMNGYSINKKILLIK